MKSLLILCVLLFSFVFASEDEAVLTLDASNFDKAIEDNDLIMVEFYAPWCGHCKRLAPEYEAAAKELGNDFKLAKVDADDAKNRDLATRYEIRGFPTLKLFRNGVAKDYEGGRTAADIVSYMKKQALPVITMLEAEEDVKTFSESDNVVVIGFFEKEDDHFALFKSTAEKLRDKFVFGAVIGKAEVNKAFEVEATPSAILFKKFDEGKNVLGAEEFATVESFVNVNSVPLIDEIGPENYRKYIESGLPLAYLFVDLKVEGQKEENVKKIEDVAKEMKGKINFVYIDWSKFAKHSERLGLSGKTVPAFAIEDSKGLHYAFPEDNEFSDSELRKWIETFEKGELKPTIKSEPIPENNDGPVTVVVADNFDEIVMDESKDVLVEFYAPWCGHCKKLAPTFEELGKKFSDVESVVIAKIDATANDVDPSLGIRGFPTLKFFPANDKTPIDYEGDRSLDDLFKFVKEKASKPINEGKEGEVKDEL